jgi:tRNA(adenine34) deaminase
VAVEHGVDSGNVASMFRAPPGDTAPIAQLDRALVYGTRCRTFESSWAREDWAIGRRRWSAAMAATRDHVDWMRAALALADDAGALKEVPVGCVIVGANGEELGRGHNARERLADPTAHAEIIAVREAARRSGSWRLEGSTAYVTLEPCPMCAGALVLARIARVVYGCSDPKAGAVATLFSIGSDVRLNHRFEVVGGVLADECAGRLQRFFAALRSHAQ